MARSFTSNQMKGLSGRTGQLLNYLLILPILVLSAIWAAAALWFDGPSARWLAFLSALGFVSGSLGLLLFVRPLRNALALVTAGVAAVTFWWVSMTPSNDRDWQPDVARLATSSIDGNRIIVRNLRNFDYRTEIDGTENWETRSYDLNHLRGVDLFLCFWGPKMIAHTITSWDFGDNSHLAISIETRKEKGEEYSAVRGFFRQYEIYYVVADELDVVRLRTNHRGEKLFLYRVNLSRDQARALLTDYLGEINRLTEHPRWYNALVHNCTTAIRYHLKNLGLAQKLDWRILANGRLDALMYDRGLIDTSFSLTELRRRSDITELAKAADKDPLFSNRIRKGLPGLDREEKMNGTHTERAQDAKEITLDRPI